MPRFSKTLKHLLFKKKCQNREKESLVSQMNPESSEHAHENPTQNSLLMKTKDKFDEDPRMYDQETNPPILTDALSGARHIQKLKDAAEQVKQWKNQIGFRTYYQCRLKDYIMEVEIFVKNNFPSLPTTSQTPTDQHLNDAMSLICNMVTGLVPVLEDSVLVNYLLESYNKHLFGMLSLLIDRSSSVKDFFFLLQWVKKAYFRPDLKGCLHTENGELSLLDPFLFADWLKYSKQKLLTLLQNNISTTLCNILQHDEPNSVGDDNNEEACIQVQLDVIQCLNAPIQASETISHTLKNDVKILCCNELHTFMEKYMNAQGADEANLLSHFKRIYTCRQLRAYALSIIDPNSETDSSTLLMLENTEKQILSSVHQCFEKLAKDNLENYFNNKGGRLKNQMTGILNMLASLPNVEQGEETKQLIVKAALASVTRAYLQCLMQRKYQKLEKSWDDVEKRIMQDAEYLNVNFANENGSDYGKKTLLLKMGEIVQCRDLDILKLLCSEMYMKFPKESEEYIPTLLRWRGKLSRKQIKEVIDVSRDQVRNRDHVRPHPCMSWWCCFS